VLVVSVVGWWVGGGWQADFARTLEQCCTYRCETTSTM